MQWSALPNGVADGNKQFKSLRGPKPLIVAVLGDGNSANQFHDKIWIPAYSSSGIEDFGNILMIHHGDGLALRLESNDRSFRIDVASNDF